MKWIRTMVCALGMLACVSLSAFAAEYGEPNITTETTMKELRENPSIKGSGYYTYCNEWIEGSTQYDDTPIEGYVSYAAAEDAAEGMNLVIENYNRGVQITWQVYTPEEIAENPSLGMVQLYYFPAKTANAKYAIVVPGNGGNTTAELNEGASIANQLHELGYAAFVLRYRSFLNASDNAPLYDIANAVKYLTENADQFGVQRENYALMGFSSGGHIVGLIGSDNEKFGYKAFGLPQPAALLLGYPKKFLLNPVKNVIAERKAKADSQIADATKLRTEAEAMKAEYEQNLQNARTEANEIVANAQKTATARGEEIVGEARAQAAALKQKAEADIAQERKKAVNEVKDEIGGMAMEIASKVVEREIKEADHQDLIDEFIKNVGEAS